MFLQHFSPVPGGRSITQHDLKLVFLSIVTVLASESICVMRNVRQVVVYWFIQKGCVYSTNKFLNNVEDYYYYTSSYYWYSPILLHIITYYYYYCYYYWYTTLSCSVAPQLPFNHWDGMILMIPMIPSAQTPRSSWPPGPMLVWRLWNAPLGTTPWRMVPGASRWIQVPGTSARYNDKLWNCGTCWKDGATNFLRIYTSIVTKIQLKIPTWKGKTWKHHGNTNNIWPITLQGAAIQYPELQKSRRVRSSPPCRILSLQAVDPSVPVDVGTANSFNEPCTKVMLSQDS